MTMFPDDLTDLAGTLLDTCRRGGLRMAVAESCTGGLIAACLTSVAGSSDVVDRGFVTYTNEAKHEVLGVPDTLFDRVGAVSEEVARAMAEGALGQSHADLSVAVTGIAGPGGATPDKPVGLVHVAAARAGHETLHESHVFPGDRQEVRLHTVEAALKLAWCLAEAKGTP
jgi:nicotinamide-nucleotide amidase